MKKYDLILRMPGPLSAVPGSEQGVHLLYTVQVAEAPAPPWTRVPQRAPRPRRDPLTQDTIVDAALAVLDADGLELLSMRHVARTLNTTAAALYWHVGSKDGLLDLIFDRVIGEQPVPDPEPGPLGGADQGRRAHDAADDPRPPRHRAALDRPHPAGSARAALRRPRARHPARRRPARPARGGRAAAPDVDRHRLRDRRDGRGRAAARRPAGGRHGERLPRVAAQRAVPQPRRGGPAHGRDAAPTRASSCCWTSSSTASRSGRRDGGRRT